MQPMLLVLFGQLILNVVCTTLRAERDGNSWLHPSSAAQAPPLTEERASYRHMLQDEGTCGNYTVSITDSNSTVSIADSATASDDLYAAFENSFVSVVLLCTDVVLQRQLPSVARPLSVACSRNSSEAVCAIDGSSVSSRIFDVKPEGSLYLLAILLKNGHDHHGGSLRIQGPANATLQRCILQHNHAEVDGGAIHAVNASVTLDDCTLMANSAGSRGGAVYASGSAVLLQSGALSENTAKDGGGIYGEVSEAVRLTGGVSISTNRAEGVGGGIMLTGEGALAVDGGSSITENFAMEGGAGVFMEGASTALGTGAGISCTITGGSSVSGNWAKDGNGGGILVQGRGAELMIGNGSMISGNRAWAGGGAYLGENGRLVVQGGSTFSQNSADDLAGAVMCMSSSEVVLMDSRMSGNYAKLCAGGMLLGPGTRVQADGVSLDNNTAATGPGGAVFLSPQCVMEMRGSVVTHNYGKTGGGIDAENNCSIFVHNSTISHNVVQGSAGGIRLQNKGILDLASSVISENVAFLGGAGIYCDQETTCEVVDSELVANHVHEGNGAGMLGFSMSSVHLIRCTFSNNVAEYSGAAVYLYAGTSDRPSTLEVVGGSMERNLAGFHGGAIAAWHNSVVIISSDVRIHGNRAKEHGGGVTAQTSWVTIRDNVTISNNTALRGGAMFLDSCRTNISGQVRLTMNRATADGGGIWASNSTVELGNVTRAVECAAAVDPADSSIAEKLMLGTMGPCLEVHLDSNHARHGGGIGLERSWIEAAGMNLERNEADYDGGGLYVAASWVLLQISSLVENRAMRGAGTMGMDGSNFTVLDAMLANNSASGDGGANHLYTDVPSATMRRTRVFGNRAERGAVAFLAGEPLENASLFHLNLDDCHAH
ncbi:hypothetical protein CYMTET_8355, partial [Cymbomonas tetramitiformis]